MPHQDVPEHTGLLAKRGDATAEASVQAVSSIGLTEAKPAGFPAIHFVANATSVTLADTATRPRRDP